MINPYIDMNKNKPKYELNIPVFDKKHKFTIRLSAEATTVILGMLGHKDGDSYPERRIAALLERIGVGSLQVVEATLETDEESGVTTEDCRQSGYEDGLMGNPKYFAAIYGNMKDVFQQAYLRGFFEGNYVRNKDK